MRKTVIGWILGVGYWIFFSIAAFAPLRLCAADPTSPGGYAAAGWPQIQCNPQRTGYTAENVAPPYKQKWQYSFAPVERVSPCLQPVVYGQRVFAGTLSGRLHAINAETGRLDWDYRAGAPIAHSAGCMDGRVFCADLAGVVHAVNAADGKPLWRSEPRRKGYTGAVLVAGREHGLDKPSVFLGCRDGRFLCFSQEDGGLLWEFDSGAPIVATAAYDKGRVFFGNEDMFLFCLDAATGELKWKSDKLYGQSFRDYYPVVHKGRVMVRTMVIEIYDMSYNYEGPWWLDPFHWFTEDVNGVPFKEHFEALRAGGGYPEGFFEVQERMKQIKDEHPTLREFYSFDQDTGKLLPELPLYNVGRNNGACPPPAVDSEGMLLASSMYCAGARFVRIDLDKGLIVDLTWDPGKAPCIPGDETHAASCGGEWIFNMHSCGPSDGRSWAFNSRTREAVGLSGESMESGFSRFDMQSAGHAAAISDGRLYHIAHGVITAIQGTKGDNQ